MRTRNDDGLGWVGAVSALEGPGGACLRPDGKYCGAVKGRHRGSGAGGLGRSYPCHSEAVIFNSTWSGATPEHPCCRRGR